MSDNSHLRMIDNGAKCFACGEEVVLCPNDLDLVCEMLEDFRNDHEGCEA